MRIDGEFRFDGSDSWGGGGGLGLDLIGEFWFGWIDSVEISSSSWGRLGFGSP